MLDLASSSYAFASPKTAIGRTVGGRYKLDGCLGKGGMGIVYRATDLETRERVAVKVVTANDDRAGITARVFREATILRNMTNEHAVRVYDVGTIGDGTPYLVLELLRGEDLGELLEERGPFELARAVDLILQGCEAIAEAHSLGIVHRDLKPDNLYLTRKSDGTDCVKVIDFGIAKCRSPQFGQPALTQANYVMGSPRYMAPEQMEASDVIDHRADIWSIGVMLHELVTGRAPYEGDSLLGIFQNILAGPPTKASKLRPDLPTSFDDVIARCLAVEPDGRYQSVAALAEALAPYASKAGKASIARILNPDCTAVAPLPLRLRSPNLGERDRNDRRAARTTAIAVAIAAAAGVLLSLARPSFREASARPESAHAPSTDALSAAPENTAATVPSPVEARLPSAPTEMRAASANAPKPTALGRRAEVTPKGTRPIPVRLADNRDPIWTLPATTAPNAAAATATAAASTDDDDDDSVGNPYEGQ